MKWITHFENPQWRVESNAVNAANDIFYTWEKALIKVTWKIGGGIIFYINGEKYEVFSAGEFVILEITDQTRAFNSGSVLIEDYEDRQIAVINWVSRKGERPTESNIDRLPSEIGIDTHFTGAGSSLIVLPFWMQVSEKMEVFNGVSWINFYTGGDIMSFDVSPAYNDDTQFYRTKNRQIPTSFINLTCTTDMILFEWIGRFGVKKSWWFKIDKTVYSTSKTLDIQTMDNGFNTLKDKNTNLIISHRNADNLTQNYLSDIVLSDDVFCYPDETLDGKIQVKIDNNNFEVSKRNRDIILTVNKNQYDTI